MRRKRDPYTLFLPFDESSQNDLDLQRGVLLERLGRYLAAGRSAPKHLPLLRLLPSLNNHQPGEKAIKFTEDEAAKLLLELGASIEPNPHYLGRSHYRVTIPLELIERAIVAAKKEE
jgi:hypothetical protein